MDESKKIAIVDSFPAASEEADLGVSISQEEFSVFEAGVFAGSMDEKWNAFVINNVLIFSRSWTNNCIYKIYAQKYDDHVILKNYKVNRDPSQYGGKDITHDDAIVRKLIQGYLRRDDIYIDPKQKIELIKLTIEKEDPFNNYLRSTGSQPLKITRFTYNSLSAQIDFYELHGWDELKKKTADKGDDEHLISLHMQHKQNGEAKTFYFDKNGTELLGEIIIHKKGLANIFEA